MIRQGIAIIPFHERNPDNPDMDRSYLPGTVCDPSVQNNLREEVSLILNSAGTISHSALLLLARLAEPEVIRAIVYFMRVARNMTPQEFAASLRTLDAASVK